MTQFPMYFKRKKIIFVKSPEKVIIFLTVAPSIGGIFFFIVRFRGATVLIAMVFKYAMGGAVVCV